MTTEIKPRSRSEREAEIKDRAGWVITVLAALLAITTLIGGGNSSRILNDTLSINDTWGFYQAKSIKQTAYELAAAQAEDSGNKSNAEKFAAKAASYESDPASGEGKTELLAKAKALEAERTAAQQRSPMYTYAGSLFQIAIVLLTASILAVSMSLFWGSILVGTLGSVILAQAVWLIFPVTL